MLAGDRSCSGIFQSNRMVLMPSPYYVIFEILFNVIIDMCQVAPALQSMLTLCGISKIKKAPTTSEEIVGAASIYQSYYFLVELRGSSLDFADVSGELSALLLSVKCHRDAIIAKLNCRTVLISGNGCASGFPFSAFGL